MATHSIIVLVRPRNIISSVFPTRMQLSIQGKIHTYRKMWEKKSPKKSDGQIIYINIHLRNRKHFQINAHCIRYDSRLISNRKTRRMVGKHRTSGSKPPEEVIIPLIQQNICSVWLFYVELWLPASPLVITRVL